LARRFGPRNAEVSAGSARCAITPALAISSAMYRQPVQPSIANATGPAAIGSIRVSQSARCFRSAGVIRPRSHFPFRSSTQSNVSCFRWMSKPPTIDIGTSSSSVTIDVQRRNVLRLS
jgi:hypothetical protein